MRYLPCILALLILSACSSADVTEEVSAYQLINVNTPGQVGAKCFLQAGGRNYSIVTPAQVNVHRNAAPMTVTCFKGEHMAGKEIIRPLMAPVEKNAGESCRTCVYPATIIVAMGLNDRSFDIDLKEIK